MGFIRFFLAASIVFAHSPSGIPYVHGLSEPLLTVESFFIISGFYIAMVYSEHYGLYPHAKAYFYKSRYFRLYPSYFICMTLMLASLVLKGVPYQANPDVNATFVSSWDELKFLFRHMHFIPRMYQVFSNFTLFGYDLANFLDINPATGETSWTYVRHENERFLQRMLMPQAWTIGVELAFYLLAPFLTRLSLKPLLSLALISLAYKLLLFSGDAYQFPFSCGFSPAELGLFAWGILAYRFYRKHRSFIERISVRWYPFFILSVVGAGYWYIWIPAIPAVKYPLFLVFVAAMIPFVFAASRRLKWDRFIGELSYPIYVGHAFVDYQLNHSGQYRGLYTLLGSTMLAVFLVLFVEHPITAWRRRPVQD